MVDFDRVKKFVYGAFGASNINTANAVLLEMGVNPEKKYPEFPPSACASGNHYENDGNGRDFDFCPDCGEFIG